MYHTRTKEGFAFAHSVSAAEFDQIACDQQRSLRVRCEQTQFERLLRCVETRVDTAIFVQENRPSIGTGRRTAIRSIRDVVVINAQERDVVIVLESFDSHAAADLARDAEHMATRLRELRNTVNALTETNGGLLARVADLEPRALDEQSSFLAWACVALVKMHLPYDPIARVLRGDVEGLEGIHENSVADIARFFANAPAPYSVHAQRALDRVRLAHTLRELSRKRGQTKTTFALADGGDTETKLLTAVANPGHLARSEPASGDGRGPRERTRRVRRAVRARATHAAAGVSEPGKCDHGCVQHVREHHPREHDRAARVDTKPDRCLRRRV